MNSGRENLNKLLMRAEIREEQEKESAKIATPAATSSQPVSLSPTSTSQKSLMTVVEMLGINRPKKPRTNTPPNIPNPVPDPVEQELKRVRGLLENQNQIVFTTSPSIFTPPPDPVGNKLKRVLASRTQMDTDTNQKRPIEATEVIALESPAPKRNKTSNTISSVSRPTISTNEKKITFYDVSSYLKSFNQLNDAAVVYLVPFTNPFESERIKKELEASQTHNLVWFQYENKEVSKIYLVICEHQFNYFNTPQKYKSEIKLFKSLAKDEQNTIKSVIETNRNSFVEICKRANACAPNKTAELLKAMFPQPIPSSLQPGLFLKQKYDVTDLVKKAYSNKKSESGNAITKDKNGNDLKITMVVFDSKSKGSLTRRSPQKLIQEAYRRSLSMDTKYYPEEVKKFISHKKYPIKIFEGEIEGQSICAVFFQERFLTSEYRDPNKFLNDKKFPQLPQDYQNKMLATFEKEQSEPTKKGSLSKTLKAVLDPEKSARESQPKIITREKLFCLSPDSKTVIDGETIEEYAPDKSSNWIISHKKYDITDEVKEVFPEIKSKVTIIFFPENCEEDHTKIRDVILNDLKLLRKSNDTAEKITDKNVKTYIQEGNKPCVKFYGKFRAIICYESVLEARTSQYYEYLNEKPEKLPPHVSQMLKNTLINDKREKQLREDGLPIEENWKTLYQNLYHRIKTKLIDHKKSKKKENKAEADNDTDRLSTSTSEESGNEKSSSTTVPSIVQLGTLFGGSRPDQVSTEKLMSMDDGKDEVPVQKRQ